MEDSGYLRHFRVLLDEIAISGPTGTRIQTLDTPAASPTALTRAASLIPLSVGERADLVLLETGQVRDDYQRRYLSPLVLVALAPGANPQTIAHDVGALRVDTYPFAPDLRVFTAPGHPGAALELALALRARPEVLSADPLLEKKRAKRFTPNDTLFTNQWHLRNTGQGGGTAGIDVRITNVWAQGYFGSNIVIGIVDDGVQYTHPDLAPNYAAAYSRNWNGSPGGPFDPAPNLAWDDHGTPCAGVAAGRGNNSIGISGAAPFAQFAGLRLISTTVGDSQEAESVAYSNQHLFVKSNSWGPSDNGRTMEAPGPLTRAAFSNSTATGRNGRGTIHVWAGGNGRNQNDNANNDGYANSIYTISIAAITDGGLQAWYSEPGACHVVTAPSSGGNTDIITTDLLGGNGYNYVGASGELSDRDYTQTFGGTSSSTPLVAGIVALMLEARPTLGWRDVQEILIRTARHINPSDSLWRTNSAGFTFNPKFGSGLIDANAALATALTWTNLGPQQIIVSNRASLNLSIPDNNAAGVSVTFNLSTNIRVEHATITVGISHARRGQLEAFLVSPHGITSQLSHVRALDTNAFPSTWTYMTVHNWGETSQGTWTLRVADRTSGTVGTLNSAHLILYGTSTQSLTNQPPEIEAISPPPMIVGQPVSFNVTANDPFDGDLITLIASNLPPWAVFNTATGSATVSSTLTGTPNTTGSWATVFHAFDKDGFSRAVIPLVVNPTPPKTPPILQPIGNQNGASGSLLSFPVTATPTDGDPVTLSASNLPPGAVFSSTGEVGGVAWTPTADQLGTYPVTFFASDIDGSTSRAVTITIVAAPNHPAATNLLAYYSFDGPGGTFTNAPQTVAPLVTASLFTTDNNIFTDVTGTSGRAITASSWTSSNRFYTFTLSIPAGYALTIGRLSFEHQRSQTGPGLWNLFSSANAFAATIAEGPSSTTFSSNQIPLGLSALTGSVTIRIRGENASGANGTWRLDNVRLFGHLALLPTNAPPVFFALPAPTLQVGDTLNLPVSALDTLDGDPITLSSGPLPFFLSFPPVTQPATATSHLTGTFPWSGTYAIDFFASDKDGLTTTTLLINVASPPATLVQTSFDAGLPPGWTVTTNAHPSAYWRFDNPGNRTNFTGGAGPFAIADSDHAGSHDMDTELRTPSFSLLGSTNATLTFRNDFEIFTGNETADVDVSLNGPAGPWSNLWRRQSNLFGPITIPIDLAPALGSTNVMVRFRYYNANWDWWWQVDDVQIIADLPSLQLDSDGDGLPDAWELAFFGDLTTAGIGTDFTMNDVPDVHAFIAGLDPTDPTAWFTVQALPASGNAPAQLLWPSLSNRIYYVSRSTSLPHFTTIAAGLPATPPLNTFIDPSPPPGQPVLYRIGVNYHAE
mgnify:CR=1 FL=1